MYNVPIAIEHPVSLKVVNAVGALLARFGIRPFGLDAGKILDKAEKTTGFSYHDKLMREGLERLVESIADHSRLNTFGRFALSSTVQRAAIERFRIEQAIAERPEILDEPIREPVFIIGMPRSGTSILQALLYRDFAHRSPLSWECLLPYPASTEAEYLDNPRIDTIRREFDQIFRLVPDFRKKHYMEADSPQECVGITALNFASFMYLPQAYIPDYTRWFFDAADQAQNFRWHRRFLQFLQSGGVRRPRWLLKSPVHLMRLRALFEVYPDARVIMTHRHPAHIVPSAASLISSMRSLYTNHEDVERTGRENLDLWAAYFRRFLRDRRQLNVEDRIIDLLFDDFVDDQMHVVEQIYDRFGWQLDRESAARMARFLEEQRRGKYGEHEYSLQQIGVCEDEVDARYADYLEFLSGLDRAPRQHTA